MKVGDYITPIGKDTKVMEFGRIIKIIKSDMKILCIKTRQNSAPSWVGSILTFPSHYIQMDYKIITQEEYMLEML